MLLVTFWARHEPDTAEIAYALMYTPNFVLHLLAPGPYQIINGSPYFFLFYFLPVP